MSKPKWIYFCCEDGCEVFGLRQDGTIHAWIRQCDNSWLLYMLANERKSMIPGTNIIIPFGFHERTDLPYPLLTYKEWYSDPLDVVAPSTAADLCSDNAQVRFLAYVEMIKYFGPLEFDQYPMAHDPKYIAAALGVSVALDSH